MWTWARYRTWLERKTRWFVPGQTPDGPDSETSEYPRQPAVESAAPEAGRPLVWPTPASKGATSSEPKQSSAGRIEIAPAEGGLAELLKKLEP